MDIADKAKNLFSKMITDFGLDPYQLKSHLCEVEKWAGFMLKKYPEADKEIVMLSVWLHDVGHYPLPIEIDHAVRSEQKAKEFLERENFPKEKMNRILHCVRAHRCRDIVPETLEAKIIAFIDSASHLTDSMYFEIAKEDKENGKEFKVFSKIERDFRDLSLFPEIKENLLDLYDSWKSLLHAYEKIDLK